MPARPLITWPLIALLIATPATAQDASSDAATDPEAEAPVADAAADATAEEAAEETTDDAAGAAPEAQAVDPVAEAPAPAEGGEAQGADAAEAEAPAEGGAGGIGLSLGQEGGRAGEPEVGQVYVRDAFTDWELRCERAASGEDPCQLYQLLEDQEGNAVAEISVFDLPDGAPAAAGATIVTPLMTLLTEQLTIAVDGGTARRYPFSWCSAIGCIARVGFTDDEVQAFRGGNTARLSIVPAAAPDQRVDLDVSLSGFTAGLQAVAESGPPVAQQ